MQYAAATHVGQKRDHNEDAVTVLQRNDALLMCVADGMGGHENGEVASQMVIDALNALSMRGSMRAVSDSVREALRCASDKIYNELRRAGTTAVSVTAHASADHVVIENCGDSRAYMIRGITITQLTEDDSFVNGLVKAGRITKDEAREYPGKNIITCHIGIKPDELQIVQTKVPVRSGDIILLCSDGLSGELTDAQILGIVKRAKNMPDAAKKLISAANKAGGRDNITVALCRF